MLKIHTKGDTLTDTARTFRAHLSYKPLPEELYPEFTSSTCILMDGKVTIHPACRSMNGKPGERTFLAMPYYSSEGSVEQMVARELVKGNRPVTLGEGREILPSMSFPEHTMMPEGTNCGLRLAMPGSIVTLNGRQHLTMICDDIWYGNGTMSLEDFPIDDVPEDVCFLFVRRDVSPVEEAYQEILKMAKVAHHVFRERAVMDVENLLDEAFLKMGVTGKTFYSRLVAAHQGFRFPNFRRLESAHLEVRNAIAHQRLYRASKETVLEVLMEYWAALKRVYDL
jgi:hypothetical protein